MSISDIFVDVLGGEEITDFSSYSPTSIAQLYVLSALFDTASHFIEEQWWIYNQQISSIPPNHEFIEFFDLLLETELIEFKFFKERQVISSVSCLKELRARAKKLESKLIAITFSLSKNELKKFSYITLTMMKALYLIESDNQIGRTQNSPRFGLQLYRTFDSLDQVFRLDYGAESSQNLQVSTKERLYEGSGVNVQSGYSSIILALNLLNLQPGTTIVDLGSGYGRVGLAATILYDDIRVIGYEYVKSRVDIANEAACLHGIEDSLRFITQDLSSTKFTIPNAEVYYLYDPFTAETYRHIADQLECISKVKTISIITKGHASSPFISMSERNGWNDPQVLDNGNMNIFSSE